jgi:hypothetical protein
VGALAVEAVIVARTPSIGTAETAVSSWQAARRAAPRIGTGAAVAAAPFTGAPTLLTLEAMPEVLSELSGTPVRVPLRAAPNTLPLAVAAPRPSGEVSPRGRRRDVTEQTESRERRSERAKAGARVQAKSEDGQRARRAKAVKRRSRDKKPGQRERRGGSDGGAAAWHIAPHVTWYGSDFFGNRTACGQRYSRKIIGVAHKTLPCGTLVQFRWRGITATAPVIDRGPYGPPGYVFDFSAALSCDVFRPKGVENGCFTRHKVAWRIVGSR